MGRSGENKKAVPYDPAFCLVRRPRTGRSTFFFGKALQGREDHAFDILNEESKAHTGNNSASKTRLQRCHIDDFPDNGNTVTPVVGGTGNAVFRGKSQDLTITAVSEDGKIDVVYDDGSEREGLTPIAGMLHEPAEPAAPVARRAATAQVDEEEGEEVDDY